MRALALLAFAACSSSERASPPPAPSLPVVAAPRVDATPLLAKFECNRCHAGTTLADAAPTKHCVGCHQDILASTFEAPPEVLARWQRNLTSLRVVPSLVGVGARLRREWIAQFLLAPHDVRPALPATMPRFAIARDEAKAIAACLVPSEAASPPAFSTEEVAQGRALYAKHFCGACHVFTGADVAAAAHDGKVDAQALAPDLAFARERLQRGAVAEFIANPTRHKPDAKMPALEVSAEDARALAAFVLEATLAPTGLKQKQVPTRLPLLERPVAWAEVSEKVFRVVCWHCHSTPDYALGDGGPGNTGGFGFAARGLDLARHSGIMAGAYGEDGKRRSIFAPMPDGTPRLVAMLLARQAEGAGTLGPLRGMPLGLPALSAEQIQLVETWIAQGRKP